MWKVRQRSRVGGSASGRRRKTGKIIGVVGGAGCQVMNGVVEGVREGMRGREEELEAGRESGSKCGGVMSMGQDEKRAFLGEVLGRITPRV